MQVRDVGEQGLLSLFRPFCDDRMGDDAVLMGSTYAGHSLVVTTDMLVDGVHFSDQTTTAEDVGWRAAAANLSDLAAMGARPWGMVMAVGLRADTPISWIEGVYQGFTQCTATYDTLLVGGDTVGSSLNTLSVTAFGQVPFNKAIYRHTAHPGDSIIITGSHGLSKAGLEILCHPILAEGLTPEEITLLKQSHQRPRPRFDVIPHLWEYTDRVTGMDSSDGLADALIQICRLSGVGAQIFWNRLPISPLLEKLVGDRALDWFLYGGEDFELVLCLAPQAAEALVRRLPGCAIIGTIVAGEGVEGITNYKTFQHFS